MEIEEEKSISSLMKTLKTTAKQAMGALKVPENGQAKYKNLC